MRNLRLYLDQYRGEGLAVYDPTDKVNDGQVKNVLLAQSGQLMGSVHAVDKDGNTLLHLVLEELAKDLPEKDRYVLLHAYYGFLLSSPHLFLPNKKGVTPYYFLKQAAMKNTQFEHTYPDWKNAFKLQGSGEYDKFNALMLLKTENDVANWLLNEHQGNTIKDYLEKPLFTHPTRGAYTPKRILIESGNFNVLSLLTGAIKLQKPSAVNVLNILLGIKEDVNVHRGWFLTRWGLTKTASDIVALEKKRIIAEAMKPLAGMDVLLYGLEKRTTHSLRNEWNTELLAVLKNLAKLVSTVESKSTNASIIQYCRRSFLFGMTPESVKLIQQVLDVFPHKEQTLNGSGRLDDAQVLALNRLAEYAGLVGNYNQFKVKLK